MDYAKIVRRSQLEFSKQLNDEQAEKLRNDTTDCWKEFEKIHNELRVRLKALLGDQTNVHYVPDD